MPHDDLLPATVDALAPHFGESVEAPLTLEAVRAYLEGHVARLLDRNPALLMSILYRVDVAERDVQRVLRTSPTVAADLADLLLERQLEKVRLRRAYRGRT